MDKIHSSLQQIFGDQRVKIIEPLYNHTVLKMGGPADIYIEIDTSEALVSVIELAHAQHIPFLVIGSGSKTLVSDDGFRGLVIKNNTRKFDVMSRKGKIRNNRIAVDRAYVYADSGALLNQVVRFTIEQHYAGLENMLGLSGTVGGRLFMDTNDDEDQKLFDQHIYQIQTVTHDGTVRDVTKSDLVYTDRNGRTKRGNFIVLAVIFELFPGNAKTLWDKAATHSEKRQAKQPESTQAIRLFSDITVAEAMSIPTPNYTRSVRYLIEKAGLTDLSVGDAKVIKEFPEYIINSGNATSNDMIKLVKKIKQEIHNKFGVYLRETVQIVE